MLSAYNILEEEKAKKQYKKRPKTIQEIHKQAFGSRGAPLSKSVPIK